MSRVTEEAGPLQLFMIVDLTSNIVATWMSEVSLTRFLHSTMSRTSARRALAQSPILSISEYTSTLSLPLRCLRPFSSTSIRKADGDGPPPPKSQAKKLGGNAMTNLANKFGELVKVNMGQRKDTSVPSDGTLLAKAQVEEEPHHFHVNATRHNTHITLTRPDRSPIISLSCGNIGFRHSGRKHYDSAFQLASLVMARIHERAINREIKELEFILRGFGAGREAVTKALLGTEGRMLRLKVVKVTDATRLKFGGTRSQKPRRLG